ncbi:HD domain-containing protein [Spongiactinospora sp. TRM90649]|uniref:HD domain-containing protein n=1 Tax=Spongiactinospora sp. TRM90649 TaxID=3031114 RepID=UPI0023F7E353|nr:HD domain-containing protein [Spongiactinospora sp. TRM90649]MDF5752637.1 HD domain-containing protein [Spongiactinospora sp. TRM90649]
MRLADIEIPATAAARAAHEVAAAYCPPALLNHSVRSYLWAAGYAGANGVAFDAELLYVAAMLHDIGLVPEFDAHTVPFEEAGGHVAWAFAAGAGWPPERRKRVSEVIVRHMWAEVDVAEDPEGHLLELSTALDISGRHPEAFPAGFRAEVLAGHPRLGISREFLACFSDQARRKPGSLAAEFFATGFTERITTNPLDEQDVSVI